MGTNDLNRNSVTVSSFVGPIVLFVNAFTRLCLHTINNLVILPMKKISTFPIMFNKLGDIALGLLHAEHNASLHSYVCSCELFDSIHSIV